ncbi:E3 ubiquitin-protein ligase TRAIP isoform X2 [Megalopta genalis]|uniref:E3 ubiquitin-protein ligase TRAIP isoform X2 n=1 Tax=Megalopta genalis TaxID=115081 RepID=UPI003FD4A29D
MNIACAVCSDLLTETDDISHTSCGHVFHFVCLSQWLRKFPTCPQCTKRTASHKIHRLYFNFCNNDRITDEIHSLQDKVDILSLELTRKEKDAKHYSEKSEAIEKKDESLRKEILHYSHIRDIMQQRLNHVRKQASKTDSMKKDNKRLRKQLETYINIQTLRKAFQEDIDDMDTGTADNNFCTIMRSNMKSLQQKLSKTTMEKEFLSEDTSTKFVTLLWKHNLKYCIYFSLHLLASSFFPYASYSI